MEPPDLRVAIEKLLFSSCQSTITPTAIRRFSAECRLKAELPTKTANPVQPFFHRLKSICYISICGIIHKNTGELTPPSPIINLSFPLLPQRISKVRAHNIRQRLQPPHHLRMLGRHVGPLAQVRIEVVQLQAHFP